MKTWSLIEEPIRVRRIAGPASPLYTLGENGAHRLTTALLAALPGVWAIIEQEVLPLRVRPHQVRIRNAEAGALPACWRGLMSRGLVTGRLEEDVSQPTLSTLHLDDSAALWLLGPARSAVAWAATYDHAYPGALADLGIAPEVYADARSWTTWLTA
ncbi:hypothetical protein FDA94_00830 [Herbidospora galbida]|uniref:Uncharacterized protein n=1 Tax=Herbidospora galbida TaxID=2575442 RepID=A0A4V5V0F5_9ACTN|nr:hypothetical protein [Herbidospora galbida]TKK91383.1 hypothetical protein FDA94_00830 [Herbidospora galbida]